MGLADEKDCTWNDFEAGTGRDEEFNIEHMKFEMSARFPNGIIKIGSWIYELAVQGTVPGW